jgi:hypothetical protein
MTRLCVAHHIRRQWLAGRRTLGGRPLRLRGTLTCRLTLLRRWPLLNRRAVLRCAALLSGLALLLRGLALLRRRTLLGCRSLLCPITNRIPVDCVPPNRIASAQALAQCSARRTGGSGSSQPPERLTPAAFLQSLASLR